MNRKSFARAMWESGTLTWSPAFAYGYIASKIEDLEHDVISARELARLAKIVDQHFQEWGRLCNSGVTERAALEHLAELAEPGSTSAASPAAPGSPPR